MSLQWMSNGTEMKKQQLFREISNIDNELLRSNLTHSWYKFLSFLSDDVAMILKKVK